MVQLDSIAAYLKGSPEPVTAKTLIKDLNATAPELSQAARSGAVFVWPRYRNLVRYWSRDPRGLIRERILEILGVTAMTRADLVREVRRRAFHCGTWPAESALRELLREGAVKVAKLGVGNLYYRAGHPQVLVAPSTAALAERLKRFGAGASIAVPVPGPQALEERIASEIARLQTAPGVPVTVQNLHAVLPGVAKAEFDAAVLALADRQKIYLTTHDHGWALPESERDRLVWDGGQKLYVAVALRD
jgi:plasmid stabilization system protein ParE